MLKRRWELFLLSVTLNRQHTIPLVLGHFGKLSSLKPGQQLIGSTKFLLNKPMQLAVVRYT